MAVHNRSNSATSTPCGLNSMLVHKWARATTPLARGAGQGGEMAGLRDIQILSEPGLLNGPPLLISQAACAPRVLTYTAYSDWLAVMNKRLRFGPPKHTLAHDSGSRIWPIRSPSAAY